jgi:hypothetical protein
MSLFWIVRDHEGIRSFFIAKANNQIFAWISSAIAGHQGGTPVETHELDEKTARKVPKKMIGRVLSGKEAKELLKRLEK